MQQANDKTPFDGKRRPSESFISSQQKSATESIGIDIPQISLPKGGGALKGIDDKFQVNSSNGTASFSLPLPFSKTRNGFAPSLALSYNSGAGNSPFGLGWALDVPSIQRKTDKKLPRYRDYASIKEEDVFTLAGAEDLVPELDKNGSVKEILDNGTRIRRYLPRVEGAFARIERIQPGESKTFFWRVTTKENITTIFGFSEAARLADPENSSKIFRWLPEWSYDDKGNCFEFEYIAEDLTNVPTAKISEKNRHTGLATPTNLYLKKIRYGNKEPYFPNQDTPFAPFKPAGIQYFYELVLDFGDHPEDTPAPAPVSWPCRHDPFSDYRAGFEIRTYRLCRRILFFHYFKELSPSGQQISPCLVRSWVLNYRYWKNPQATPAELENVEAEMLASIQQLGHRKNGNAYTSKGLPPMEFSYQERVWNTNIQSVTEKNLENAPIGIGSSYQWTDFYGEGISGIFTEQANGWYYKENLGDGTFTPAKLVVPRPSFSGLGNGVLQLQDLAGNGEKQLVIRDGGLQGYFELDDENDWKEFKSFRLNPLLDFRNPNQKLIDLNGDGVPDIVLSEERVFTWYEATGKIGYDAPELAPKPQDEERGAAIVFADSLEQIMLADMSGDGLTDIVRVRNGEICYWPNLGYGRFGAKVTMDNSPWFDHPDQFNPAYVQLSDVSGTGAADVVYLGKNRFRAWFNLSGNGCSPVQEIEPFPTMEQPNNLTVTDFLGNGTGCLVWSSAWPGHSQAPMRYIDLMGGKKPFVMTQYKNNVGKEVAVAYHSSTAYYLDDKKAGKPWITKLPFPVQCVSKVEMRDTVTNALFTNEYRYHHGYYDHAEREFRGFGMVEQTDTEDFTNWIRNEASNITDEPLHQPPVLTKTWYHTGAFFGKDRILSAYKKEYYHPAGAFKEYHLKDADIPQGLSGEEMREAARACKGIALRQEVYALDKSDNAPHPYTVTERNCHIRLLQAKENNPYAVFLVHESESLSYHYERNPDDPHVSHTLNLEIDEYGNVLKSAAMGYPRQSGKLKLTDFVLRKGDVENLLRKEQERLFITYTENDYTNDVQTPAAWRLRVPCDTRTYEISGIKPQPGTAYFSAPDILDKINKAEGLDYEKKSESGKSQKRLIERVRALFAKDADPNKGLQLGKLESLGISFEAFQLAFTQGLLNDIPGDFAGKTAPWLEEAKFKKSEDLKSRNLFPSGDNGGEWWISSGQMRYPANPKDHFFLPKRYIDPCGYETMVRYWDDYHLFIHETEDAKGNITAVEQFDWRVLAPQVMRDPNDNRTEVRFDVLGLVSGMAIRGKDEADDLNGFQADLTDAETAAFFQDPLANGANLLQHASSRFVYDYTALPVKVATIVRETHVTQENGVPSRLSYSFEYSDGFGRIAMKKIQAEPGPAKRFVPATQKVEEVPNASPRWVGSGRTVYNNKGKPVKQYEPYFSVTHLYEDAKELVETGVTPILFYDPVGRLFKTLLPDGSLTRVEFNPWGQADFDANDTVSEMECRWRKDRLEGGQYAGDIKAVQAAQQTLAHAATPTLTIADGLGRPVCVIVHNRVQDATNPGGDPDDEGYPTFVQLDIEGNQQYILDARWNRVMEYRYDMLGHAVYQKSMDAGERWTLNDCIGKTFKHWDARGNEFTQRYDEVHRPVEMLVREAGGNERLHEQIMYGEGRPNDKALNLRGQAMEHYNTAGLVTSEAFDFKGNLLTANRQLLKDYKLEVDWNVGPELEAEIFTTRTRYDALNRPVEITQPKDSAVIFPVYNEANLLESVRARLNGASADTVFVQNIDYNEKGQRTRIQYGNNTQTAYTYEPETFRLSRLLTTGNNGAQVLQDLNYTYDPSGNITHIEDKAQPTVFYGNAQVQPANRYLYDALYRLIKATGREHIAQANFGMEDNWSDAHNMVSLSPNDAIALRNYTQDYDYDPVGNILRMAHNTGVGPNQEQWTRRYGYAPDSNRLLRSSVGKPNPSNTYQYSYNEHGSMAAMPHLAQIDWNFKEEMHHLNLGGGGEAWNCYDAGGQRMRKVVEHPGGLIRERIYISNGYEIFRERQGEDLLTERGTVHIMDDKQRLAMVDTETRLDTSTLGRIFRRRTNPERTIRYQYANHLGTACLELDETARVISYEEYHPYGTTAYQAMNKDIRAAAKRYRYTGMERDEESGLNYHSERYYAPWLGRWCSTDPSGINGGFGLFSYANSNPINLIDVNGKWPTLSNLIERVENARQSFAETPAAHYIRGAIYGAAEAFSPVVLPTPSNSTREFEQARGIAQTVVGVLETGVGIQGMIIGGGMVLGGGAGEVLTVGVASPIAVPVGVAGAGLFAGGLGFAGLGVTSVNRGLNRYRSADQHPSASERRRPTEASQQPRASASGSSGGSNQGSGRGGSSGTPHGGSGSSSGSGGGRGGGRPPRETAPPPGEGPRRGPRSGTGGQPRYEPNPAHQPGQRGFGRHKTLEPRDAQSAFENSIQSSDSRTRWARGANNEIYRYSQHQSGRFHFSGSTGGRSGIETRHIPPEVRKYFGVR